MPRVEADCLPTTNYKLQTTNYYRHVPREVVQIPVRSEDEEEHAAAYRPRQALRAAQPYRAGKHVEGLACPRPQPGPHRLPEGPRQGEDGEVRGPLSGPAPAQRGRRLPRAASQEHCPDLRARPDPGGRSLPGHGTDRRHGPELPH